MGRRVARLGGSGSCNLYFVLAQWRAGGYFALGRLGEVPDALNGWMYVPILLVRRGRYV